MQRGKFPFRRLGERLASIRKEVHESIPEVSGAVELESDMIAAYERGETRPSEDVLDLLITHFNVTNDVADELWELAGYSHQHSDEQQQTAQMIIIPVDNRIVYTDTANVSVNNYGVVMSFMQNGPNGQPVGVARVGMSLEHAKSVLEVLDKTIRQAEAAAVPKQLPAPQAKKPRRA